MIIKHYGQENLLYCDLYIHKADIACFTKEIQKIPKMDILSINFEPGL